MNTVENKLLLSGKFLDLIFDCPYEMHDLLADPVLSAMVENLSDIQKETMFFLSLQFISTVQLACMRGRSDRNIRKLRDTYTRKLQRQLYAYLKEKVELVLDAINVGLMVLGKKSEQVIRQAALQFVEKYGLLGMMTALPVTPDFMEFPQTYFPKNRFIREKGLLTEVYMKKFFPFHDVETVKKKLEPNWDDLDHTAFWSLLNGVSDQPDAVRMTLQKEYAEPYEWVVTQLKDWAYMLSTTYFYYADGVVTDLEMNLTLQMGMEAFGGVAPSYIILLREKPTLWWHFNSLQQCIHMMLAFMLADEKNPLQL